MNRIVSGGCDVMAPIYIFVAIVSGIVANILYEIFDFSLLEWLIGLIK